MGAKTTAFCKSVGGKIESAKKLIESYQSVVTKYNDWLNNLGPEDYLDLKTLQKQMMDKNPDSHKRALVGRMKEDRTAIYEETKKFKEYITKKKVLAAMSGGFKTKDSVKVAEEYIGNAKECITQLDNIIIQ